MQIADLFFKNSDVFQLAIARVPNCTGQSATWNNRLWRCMEPSLVSSSLLSS